MLPLPAVLMRLGGLRHNWMTFDPDDVMSVFFIFVLCSLVLFWKGMKRWQYLDELPLRITVTSTAIFIYSASLQFGRKYTMRIRQ